MAHCPPVALELSALEEGVIVGLLIGEGHFGGDGRQPQITLRMHVRHEALMRWLHARVPRSKLYGPYHHGDRRYFQWMVRGPALTDDLLPLLERHVGPDLDAHTYARLARMRENYADVIQRARRRVQRPAGREAASASTQFDAPAPDSRAADSPGVRPPSRPA
jgi:hypothetical protein